MSCSFKSAEAQNNPNVILWWQSAPAAKRRRRILAHLDADSRICNFRLRCHPVSPFLVFLFPKRISSAVIRRVSQHLLIQLWIIVPRIIMFCFHCACLFIVVHVHLPTHGQRDAIWNPWPRQGPAADPLGTDGLWRPVHRLTEVSYHHPYYTVRAFSLKAHSFLPSR